MTTSRLRTYIGVGGIRCACLIAAWLGILEAPASTNDIFLTGIILNGENVCPMANSYWASWSQLPTPNAWSPEEQALPIDLADEVRRGAAFLTRTKSITNFLSLVDIEIRRVVLSDRLAQAHQRSLTDFSNQWFCCFRFRQDRRRDQLRGPIKYEYLVMLLDGTYAAERSPLRSWATTNALPAPAQRSVVRSPPPTLVSGGSSPGLIDLGEALSRPDLNRKGQWSAGTPFPVKFPDQVILLKRRLHEEYQAREDCFLARIWITQYGPPPSLISRSPRLWDQLDPWVTEFCFNEPASPSGAAYRVRVLLDGTILDVAKVP